MRQSAVDGPVMWDVISDAPMSTEHACARFLVPHLAQSGWALFMDGDVLVRTNLARLFESLDSRFAIYCVKHKHAPVTAAKMDGQIQTSYLRKNWSSFVVFNCNHPANREMVLEPKIANSLPGRDLHRFCWLTDDVIGELGPEWNYLVGYSASTIEPKVIHFTSGTPDMRGYEHCEFSNEWREELNRWAS